MPEEKKKRFPVWMYPDMIRRIDSLYSEKGFKNRSELICKAVDFYIGYLLAHQSEDYLLKTLYSVQENQLNTLGKRISGALYKLAVETDISMNITAANCNVDYETVQKLRQKCVEDVKKSLSSVNFDDVYRFQKRLD